MKSADSTVLDTTVELATAASRVLDSADDDTALVDFDAMVRQLEVHLAGTSPHHKLAAFGRLFGDLRPVDLLTGWRRLSRLIEVDAHVDAWESMLLRRSLGDDPAMLVMVAPTCDAHGLAVAGIDRVRSLLGVAPSQCSISSSWHLGRALPWFEPLHELFDGATADHEAAQPIIRVLAQLDLSITDFGQTMGVSRQAVGRWMRQGPPAQHADRLGALIEVGNTLTYRLRRGMAPIVFRRRADAYGGASWFDLFALGQHDRVLAGVRAMFDYGQIA